MSPFRLLHRPLTEDLAPYSLGLHRAGIAHRVFEESGAQVLELADARQADEAQALFERWQRGELSLAHPDQLQPAAPAGPGLWQQAPAVLVLVAMALAAYLFTGGGEVRLRGTGLLTFVDIHRVGDTLGQALGRGELWRPLAPIFLHFGILHLVFNSLIVWELGRRIEHALGSLRLLLLVAAIGVASNLAQYLLGDSPFFGGLSGVAYGLLGFVLVAARRNPRDPRWQLPQGLAISLLLFLVLFSTGVTEMFDLYVANTAHWAGLMAGGLCALAPLYRRAKEQS